MVRSLQSTSTTGRPLARRGGVQHAEVVEEHQETTAVGDRVVDGDAQA